MLLLGDSGAGKTSALASLANAGYELFIQDYDNGVRSMRQFVHPDKLKNIHYLSLQDKMKSLAGRAVPKGPPKAVDKGMKALENWPADSEGGEGFGATWDWQPNRVIVIDTLTFMGQAAMRYVLHMSARSHENPQIQDWGAAMKMQEDMLTLLYSDATKCHVVVCAHLTTVGEDGNQFYPSALGSKLPPKVSRYFNNVVRIRTSGSAQNLRRAIRTASEHNLELKVEAKCPVEIPVKTDSKGYAEGGLAELFRLITTFDKAPAYPSQITGGK